MKKLLSILILILSTNLVFANETIVIDNVNIAKQEAKEKDSKLLLIFGADWCGYCKVLEADVDKNLSEFMDGYVVCHVDYDSNRELARKYGVRSIPHSVVLDGEKVLSTKTGYRNFEAYKVWLGL